MVHKLFLGELRDIALPELAVFREVIGVEMAKGICIHGVTSSSMERNRALTLSHSRLSERGMLHCSAHDVIIRREIDASCGNAAMAQRVLDNRKVGAGLDQAAGEAVAQGMWCGRLQA